MEEEKIKRYLDILGYKEGDMISLGEAMAIPAQIIMMDRVEQSIAKNKDKIIYKLKEKLEKEDSKKES